MPQLMTLYRDLHANPELSMQEARTPAKLAAEMRKPIVMLPRLAVNREHTTDHQLHTIKWLRDRPGVFAAMSDDELDSAIDRALKGASAAGANFADFAPEPFLTRVRHFLVN